MSESLLDLDIRLAVFNSTPESDPYHARWIEDLKGVKRFNTMDHMVHRTDLFLHVFRVKYIALVAAEYAEYQGMVVDPIHVENLAFPHDNAEIKEGDLPSHVKRAMSPKEKIVLKHAEDLAVQDQANLYWPDNFAEYSLDLYEENSEKKTIESQIVKLADVCDGLGETLHEIRCGNEGFYPVLERYQEIIGEIVARFDSLRLAADFLGLTKIPSLEEAGQVPKISRQLYDEDEESFWRSVMDPQLPRVLQLWTQASLHLSTQSQNFLLPGWSDIREHEANWTLY